jgi:hypothetical protein
VLFEHAYVPADVQPERPHITTIQRLLNIQTAHILPDFEQDAYDTACTGLWDAIGDNRLSAKETCAVLVENLVDAMVILCRCNLVSLLTGIPPIYCLSDQSSCSDPADGGRDAPGRLHGP